MPTLGRGEPPQARHIIVPLASVLEELLNPLLQRGLVAFDCQQIVGTLVADCPGRCLLAGQGI